MAVKHLVIALLASAALPAAAPDSRLAEAMKSKDTVLAGKLLKQGADVNGAEADGSTALHWAAHLDDSQTLRQLIQAGANVNAANQLGVTALSLACINGNSSIVDSLLKAKADPNAASSEGETVLMTCARTGKVDAVKLLLVAGAKPNTKETWKGQSALMWAAAEGHVEASKMLLEFGADLRARSTAGFTALLFAAREGHIEVARALLKAGASVNESLPANTRVRRGGVAESEGNANGPSAMHLAVANAHFELAAMLLDAGADANAAGPGWTALHTVTWVRRPGTGSNAPAPPGSGNMGSLDIVKKLVAKGADVNARMTRRSTAGLSSLNMVGATAFLMAARTGDAELMRLLAKLGADPLIPNSEKTTALMVAAGVGTRSPGEDAGEEKEALEAVKAALELGNDVNAIDANGETAMHGAAYKHLPSVAQYLTDHGAKVQVWNGKNSHGWTPLRIAVGVHRGMNLRSSAETAAVLTKVMKAAGVSTEVEPETNISGATR